jgi:hypothetical protein
MRLKELFLAMAIVEVATGLVLLALPATVLTALFGIQGAAQEALAASRIAGAALLAIGAICALARDDTPTPAQRGVLAGILIYNVLAAVQFAYDGLALQLAGPALWPAVVLHALLAVWSILCLQQFRSPMPVGEARSR